MSEISSEQWLLDSWSITYITTNLNEVNQMIQVKNKLIICCYQDCLGSIHDEIKGLWKSIKVKNDLFFVFN